MAVEPGLPAPGPGGSVRYRPTYALIVWL